jgi:hypothetical protein
MGQVLECQAKELLRQSGILVPGDPLGLLRRLKEAITTCHCRAGARALVPVGRRTRGGAAVFVDDVTLRRKGAVIF